MSKTPNPTDSQLEDMLAAVPDPAMLNLFARKVLGPHWDYLVNTVLGYRLKWSTVRDNIAYRFHFDNWDDVIYGSAKCDSTVANRKRYIYLVYTEFVKFMEGKPPYAEFFELLNEEEIDDLGVFRGLLGAGMDHQDVAHEPLPVGGLRESVPQTADVPETTVVVVEPVVEEIAAAIVEAVTGVESKFRIVPDANGTLSAELTSKVTFQITDTLDPDALRNEFNARVAEIAKEMGLS